jgi:hypothetical protein
MNCAGYDILDHSILDHSIFDLLNLEWNCALAWGKFQSTGCNADDDFNDKHMSEVG